jgi:putative tryptophan/tyrosine transport system substrate-binding protein
VRRRDFITAIGGAVAWPLAVHAQQAAMPVIGYLSGRSRGDSVANVSAFDKGLAEVGYIVGQNVAVEYRWAEGHYDRQPSMVADLIRRPVSVIAVFNVDSAIAAKQATASIPIVFANSADPVKFGLVASLNRPGGNITGVTFLNSSLASKRLEVLHELVPKAAVIALLVNPTNATVDSVDIDAQEAAAAIGRKLVVIKANSDNDIDKAFTTFVQHRVGALLVAPDPYFDSRAEQLIALAARYAVPTIYPLREYATAGGLMSYGTSITDAFRLAGVYAGRILKGEKPADLPVQQSTKVELVINLKTAKALGLTFPITLLGRADEVIE